ncbi:hypothetical protein CXG81DRAFT_6645, partial [Caulochytrium protostelioides]
LSAERVARESRIAFRHEDLEYIAELGAGSGGTVAQVRYRPSGQLMARKIVSVIVHDESERDKTEKRLLRELKILRICRCPHVVAFYGAFAYEGDISIVMEYMDLGSLEALYRRIGPIPEPVVAHITIAVLRGLVYLYDAHRIVHRDIKPSNILANRRGDIKIADFGVSKALVNGTQARTFTGTQGYLAPERVKASIECSVEADVWSLGLTLMEIATARFPFPPEGHPPLPSVLDLLQFIEEEPAPELPADRFSQAFRDFTQRCLIKDPRHRPHPAMLLADPF